ncbi:MAG: aldose epimerase family protein [Balneolaceae bacterium]
MKIRAQKLNIIFHRLVSIYLAGLIAVVYTGCAKQETEIKSSNTITQENFGTLVDGRKADLYTLTNSRNMEVKITNYGGIITSVKVPDRDGNMENVVLGFDSIEKYQQNNPFFGATIGRFGNRIAEGKFNLNGTTYSLPVNNGNNHLHGGDNGFHTVLFDAEETESGQLKLSYLSVDGEAGYPGNLQVEVFFSLSDNNELKIEYRAWTDKATPVNLTNHSYFNLTGDPANTILDHELKLNASHYTPVDEELIPTGEITSVEGTPFDFQEAKIIGERIDKVEGGYDHNLVITTSPADSLQDVGVLYSPQSGREMKVFSMEPGVQFYSGNFLNGSLAGPDGTAFEKHSALCLETQHFPNSPNEPDFPSTILEPDEEYHTVTVYQFSTR